MEETTIKNKLITFAAGMLTALVLTAVTLPTLASDGALALTAYPVSIEVNGAAFTPTDANGKAVDVFTVNGTTYVPLRAIAETLGFEASYDNGKNLGSSRAVGEFTVCNFDAAGAWIK